MTNIPVGENYLIKSDEMNYILYEKHVSDPNHRFSSGEAKVSWNVVGYYSKFKHLVDDLLEREIKKSDADSLKFIADLLLMFSKEITGKLEELNND